MSAPIYDVHTFWELLERRVADSGDRPMLIDEADRVLTFAEVRERAERAAAGFAELGVGEGTPVTWVLPTRIETIVVSLALSRLGAVQNPIIHIYREREVGFCIRQTIAEMVLVPGEWNGFDYTAMVATATAGLDEPPKVLVAYHDLPDGDPNTLDPVSPPPNRRRPHPVDLLHLRYHLRPQGGYAH